MPERFRLTSVADVIAHGEPFVYPIELMHSCFSSWGEREPILSKNVPPEVIDAVRRGRAVFLALGAHEATILSGQTPDGAPIWFYDYVQNFLTAYDLPPDRVWLTTGNLAGASEYDQWLGRAACGRTRPSAIFPR
jgi:hypothetical protein